MKFQRLKMAVTLLTCALILAAVAIQRNGTLLGHELVRKVELSADTSLVRVAGDEIIINSAPVGGNIIGYAGSIPLVITVRDGVIEAIEPCENDETPRFFSRVEEGLLPQWIGTPLEDVADKEVDGITGATYSSDATNETIKTAVAAALEEVEGISAAQGVLSPATFTFSAKNVILLLVILAVMILPLFVRSKVYRYIQLALNVIVLGLWCGTFLSYSLFANYLSNGVNLWKSLPWLLLLVAAFIYPYFGKKSYYCTWICPLGSLQVLVGKTIRYKIPMSPSLVKALTVFRDSLWFVLMLVMCAGIYSDWMNYELFSAFLFRNAGTAVIVAAVVFVLLSLVVNRPYCRFVCPTGTLFQVAQNPGKSDSPVRFSLLINILLAVSLIALAAKILMQ